MEKPGVEKKVQSRSDVYSTLGRVVMVICRVRGALNGFMNNLARPRRPWGDEEFTGTPEQVEKLERYLDDHRMMSPDSVAMHTGTPVLLSDPCGSREKTQRGDIILSPQLFSLPVDVIDSKGEGESCPFSVSSVHDEISPEELKEMIREVEEFLDRPRRIRLARIAQLIRESETVVDDPTAHEPPVFHEYR